MCAGGEERPDALPVFARNPLSGSQPKAQLCRGTSAAALLFLRILPDGNCRLTIGERVDAV